MINFDRSRENRIKRANTDWWIHEPAMVGNNGKTYIAYCNDIGEIHIKEMDAKDSRCASKDICLCRLNCNYADEHNAPSICVMESGRIFVAYTGHGENHSMKYRITERPYDIMSFGPERELEYSGAVTYVQLSENVKNGELWLFCRVNGITWQFRSSADEGETWSEPKVFLSFDNNNNGKRELYYFNVRKQWIAKRGKPVKEQWIFALYGHPWRTDEHVIRSGIFDSDGNLLNMNGEPKGFNLRTGGAIQRSELDVVYSSPEGTTVRLLAVAPTEPYRVAFASFVLNDPDTICYYSATWREDGWELSAPIAKGGEFLSDKTMIDGSQTYVGGVAYYYGVGESGIQQRYGMVPTTTNKIYIARFDGEDRVLECYISTDCGKTYVLEQTIRKIPKDQNIKIWRPIVPIYAQDNMPLYWHEGTYCAHTGGWHSDVVMFVEYDNDN